MVGNNRNREQERIMTALGTRRWAALPAILLTLAFAAVFQFSCASDGGKSGAIFDAGAQTGSAIEKTGGNWNTDGDGFEKAGGDYRAEIEALDVPEGAEPDTFELLKNELMKQLDERFGGDMSRAISGAPQGDFGKVDDLNFYKDEFEVVHISWSYRNSGDYDLSGEVGVPDITPVALHYGDMVDIMTGWPHSVDAWIDGDKNGEIGVPDITTIAQGYLNRVAGYQILGAASPEGPWQVLDIVNFPLFPMYPLTFSYGFSLVNPADYIAVRPIDGDGGVGIASNIVSQTANELPVAMLTPSTLGGTAPLPVDFDASDSYDPDGSIAKHEWDLDGDGFYELDTGTNAFASWIYHDPGTYEMKLRVTDNSGAAAIAGVTINAYLEENLAPNASIVPDATDIFVDMIVSFDASASDDPDGSIVNYKWDFEGDGDFEYDSADSPFADYLYSAPGVFQAAVRVTDNLGATGEGSVQIIVSLNDDPVAVLFAMQDGPTSAAFDASNSFDPDGNIVMYEWDWTTDGSYDMNTGDDPYAFYDYGLPGSYIATVRVTDALGATGTSLAFVDIYEPHTWHLRSPAGEVANTTHPVLSMVDGRPSIVFRNSTNGTTRYVTSTDNFGASWDTTREIATDMSFSYGLIEANGKPAMAYEASIGMAMYAQSLFANGSSWPMAFPVEPTFGAGRMLSLSHVQVGPTNYPALATANWATGHLTFAISTDENGEIWAAPVPVDSDVGQCYPSLGYMVKEGLRYPAIAYYDIPNQQVLFIRATEQDGSLWGSPVVVDEAVGDYHTQIRLSNLGDTPVIFYFNAGNGGYTLAFSNDGMGDTWSDKHMVESRYISSGRGLDFAVVGGTPCAAYTVESPLGGERLIFRKHLGPGLGDWGPPEDVENGMFERVTLKDVNGIPGITYYDIESTPNKIRYGYRTSS